MMRSRGTRNNFPGEVKPRPLTEYEFVEEEALYHSLLAGIVQAIRVESPSRLERVVNATAGSCYSLLAFKECKRAIVVFVQLLHNTTFAIRQAPSQDIADEEIRTKTIRLCSSLTTHHHGSRVTSYRLRCWAAFALGGRDVPRNQQWG